MSTIKRITHRALPPGEPALRAARDWSICNWEDVRAGVAVQVQLRRGSADETLSQRRTALGELGHRAPSRVTVPGADAAYSVADRGVVVMAVGDDFLQLSTLGNAVDAQQRLTLAASLVPEVAQ